VKAVAEGQLRNTATVTGSQADPDTSNNSSTATTTVSPAADLSLSKKVTTKKPGASGQLGYSLTVTNGGPSTASGVTVTDTLPATESFVSASLGCSDSGQTVTCTFAGGLAKGAKATFTLVVQVAAGVTSVTNSAIVSATTDDPVPANNAASVTTNIAAWMHGRHVHRQGFYRHGHFLVAHTRSSTRPRRRS